MLFILYYKIDCGVGGGGERNIDIPDTAIGIEIDLRNIDCSFNIYTINNEFRRINANGNLYGKKIITPLVDNINFENTVPRVIMFNSRYLYRNEPNYTTISLLIDNYTYRDTWLSIGDSWCLYILGADSLYDRADRRYAAGVTFLVTSSNFLRNCYAPLSIIASASLEAIFGEYKDKAKATAVAHEIGHMFQEQPHHCSDWNCIMYERIISPPQWHFCSSCEEMFRYYYFPKRYGSQHPYKRK